MLSKRLLAFEANCERLASRRFYMWTFTRKEVELAAETRCAWNKLLTYLRRRLPGWAGVRVYEQHPGRWGEFSHGVHVHVLCNMFHDVNVVRLACKAAGWGRCHVLKVGQSAWKYLAKYLRKRRPEWMRGWRLWATFNMPDKVRIGDIVIDSTRSRLFKLGAQSEFFGRLNWMEKLLTIERWEWETVAGIPLSLPGMFGDGGAAHYPPPREKQPPVPPKLFCGERLGGRAVQGLLLKDTAEAHAVVVQRISRAPQRRLVWDPEDCPF